MKRLLTLLLCTAMLLGLCAGCGGKTKRYTAVDYAFDTEISLIAYSKNQVEFDGLKDTLFGEMHRLHRLFDIYTESSDGLYAANAGAGQAVAVAPEVTELLQFGKQAYELTEGRVNIAMGSVLRLWKTARDTGVLPVNEELQNAMQHCRIEDLMLEGNTVTLLDPQMSVDVGAIAKGWAAQKAAEKADSAGYTDYVLSAGGNIVARGTAGDRAWMVGIRDPDPTSSTGVITTVEASDMALVTSGGYERNLTVNGKTYCHIIDPETGYPADYVLSATAICPDSGLADAFSTALFLMDPENALAFAEKQGIRVILVDAENRVIDSAN